MTQQIVSSLMFAATRITGMLAVGIGDPAAEFWGSISADVGRALASAMPVNLIPPVALPWEAVGNAHVRYSPGRVLECAYVAQMRDGRHVVAVAGRIEKTVRSLRAGKRYADRRLREVGMLIVGEAEEESC